MSFSVGHEKSPGVAEELALLRPLLKVEERWHETATQYRDEGHVLDALVKFELDPVYDDGNTRPIRRFDSHGRTPGTYALLTPQARTGLQLFGKVTRAVMRESGVGHSRVRFAVTSMTRTMRYQQTLVEDPDILASPTSTHRTGNTWDIDAAAYYTMINGSPLPVMDPGRYPGRSYPEPYDPRISKIAESVAGVLSAEGLINLVPERSGTPRACLHMSAAPDILEKAEHLSVSRLAGRTTPTW